MELFNFCLYKKGAFQRFSYTMILPEDSRKRYSATESSPHNVPLQYNFFAPRRDKPHGDPLLRRGANSLRADRLEPEGYDQYAPKRSSFLALGCIGPLMIARKRNLERLGADWSVLLPVNTTCSEGAPPGMKRSSFIACFQENGVCARSIGASARRGSP